MHTNKVKCMIVVNLTTARMIILLLSIIVALPGWPIVLDYTRARQNRGQSVVIQSSLCDVACEPNSSALKIVVVQI